MKKHKLFFLMALCFCAITNKAIAAPYVQESNHIRLEIDQNLLSITPTQMSVWLSNLDRYYEQLVDLMNGLTPFEGRKMVIRSVKNIPAWAYAGDPIQWNETFVSETLKKFVTDGDWSFGILHEMGHNFAGHLSSFGNGNTSYNWNEEMFANFRMYLALTKLPDAMVNMGGAFRYGADIAEYYHENYNKEGPVNHDALMWTLTRLGDYYQKNKDHGYWLFKQAFAIINNLPNNEEEYFRWTEWKKFNYFLEILSSCAGSDVRETYSAQELNLIELELGAQTSLYIGYPNPTDITATFNNGTLTINGRGEMQDWGWGGNGKMPPWYYDLGEQISHINISDGITKVGFYAFIDCYNLISVNIGKDVNYIRGNTFWSCSAMKEIHCKNTTPPIIESDYNVFLGVNKTKCKVYVPKGSINAYKLAYGWKDFFNIIAEDGTGIEYVESGIINIFPNPTKSEIFIKSEVPIKKVEIYSLTGVLLKSENNFKEKISISALPNGVYLLKVHSDNGLIIKKIVKE